MEKFLAGTTLSIDDDGTISWKQLDEFFGECYSEFNAWLRGQTCTENGVYAWDVAQYIKGNREITD